MFNTSETTAPVQECADPYRSRAGPARILYGACAGPAQVLCGSCAGPVRDPCGPRTVPVSTGPARAELIINLHKNPTQSFLYRKPLVSLV